MLIEILEKLLVIVGILFCLAVIFTMIDISRNDNDKN